MNNVYTEKINTYYVLYTTTFAKQMEKAMANGATMAPSELITFERMLTSKDMAGNYPYQVRVDLFC